MVGCRVCRHEAALELRTPHNLGARHGGQRCEEGGGCLQIPLHTTSSVDAYIAASEWRDTPLSVCPLHPSGGCRLARHGSYARARPQGLRVARWYCPQGHRTFSLLPDFMAARLPGLLADVEEAVAVVAHAPSIETAAATVRDLAVSLPAAVRWLRRRLRPVQLALQVLGNAVARCGRHGCAWLPGAPASWPGFAAACAASTTSWLASQRLAAASRQRRPTRDGA